MKIYWILKIINFIIKDGIVFKTHQKKYKLKKTYIKRAILLLNG